MQQSTSPEFFSFFILSPMYFSVESQGCVSRQRQGKIECNLHHLDQCFFSDYSRMKREHWFILLLQLASCCSITLNNLAQEKVEINNTWERILLYSVFVSFILLHCTELVVLVSSVIFHFLCTVFLTYVFNKWNKIIELKLGIFALHKDLS